MVVRGFDPVTHLLQILDNIAKFGMHPQSQSIKTRWDKELNETTT